MRMLVVLCIVLAGCAGPAAPTVPDGPIHDGSDVDPTDRRLLPYNATDVKGLEDAVDLWLTQGSLGGASYYSSTTNCVRVHVERLISGTATVTWNAPAPMDRVRLVVRGNYTNEVHEGPSPLRVALLQDFGDAPNGYRIFLQAPTGALFVEQAFEVRLQLSYVGGAGRLATTTC